MTKGWVGSPSLSLLGSSNLRLSYAFDALLPRTCNCVGSPRIRSSGVHRVSARPTPLTLTSTLHTRSALSRPRLAIANPSARRVSCEVQKIREKEGVEVRLTRSKPGAFAIGTVSRGEGRTVVQQETLSSACHWFPPCPALVLHPFRIPALSRRLGHRGATMAGSA
ncbi:hypothetical protein PENSPDRAFT_140987 [Peniophora sp. CONT]|nr:hypothetical protein PENSPDRAFT_140987 [Peniophora sp. CONT]